jgi:hypothetical protein
MSMSSRKEYFQIYFKNILMYFKMKRLNPEFQVFLFRTKRTCIALGAFLAGLLTKRWFFVFFNFENINKNNKKTVF